MNLNIRPALLEDVDTIMSIEQTGISHPWPRESIEALINDDNKIALVVEDASNQVIGYIGATYVEDEAEIGNICILPSYRGYGAGKLLLRSLIDILEKLGVGKIFLEVEDTNEPAIALYSKLGFTKYNQRKDYYGPCRDALLFKRP